MNDAFKIDDRVELVGVERTHLLEYMEAAPAHSGPYFGKVVRVDPHTDPWLPYWVVIDDSEEDWPYEANELRLA